MATLTVTGTVNPGSTPNVEGAGLRGKARTRLRWLNGNAGGEFRSWSNGSFRVASPAAPSVGSQYLVCDQFSSGSWREAARQAVTVTETVPMVPPPSPTISNLRVTAPDANPSTSRRVQWHVSALSTGKVEYRVRGTTTWSVREPQQTAPSYYDHDQVVTGLEPSTCYDFRVTSNGVSALLTGDPMACTDAPPPTPLPSPPPPVIGTCAVTVSNGGNIQAAIDAAPNGTATNPTVICLASGGSYSISSTIRLTDRQYITIDGNGATIEATGAPGVVFAGTQELILARRGRGLRFADFTVVGTHSSPGTYITDGREFQAGIGLAGVSNVIIESVHTQDNMGDGFGLYADGATGTFNVTIKDCTVDGNGRMGVAAVQGGQLLVDNVDCSDWAWAAYEVEPDQGGHFEHATFQNGTMSGSGLLLFALNIVGGCNNITVQDNLVLAGANRGIWSTVSEPRTGRNSNITFRRNTGQQAFWEDPTGPGSGWPVRGVLLIKDIDGVVIQDNVQPVTPGFSMYGIVNNGSTAITHSGNSFPNSSGNYGL